MVIALGMFAMLTMVILAKSNLNIARFDLLVSSSPFGKLFL